MSSQEFHNSQSVADENSQPSSTELQSANNSTPDDNQEVGGADEKGVGADVIQEGGGADEKAVGADVIKEAGGADEKAGDEVVATSVEGPVNATAGDELVATSVEGPVNANAGDEVVATSVEGPVNAIAGDEVVATSVEGPVNATEMERREREKTRRNTVEYWEKNEIRSQEEKMQKEFGEIDSWKAAHKVRLENEIVRLVDEIVRLETELGELDSVAEARRKSAEANFETECAKIRKVAARNLAPKNAKWLGCFGV